MLTRTDAHRELVAARCARAAAAGVRPGMTLAHARALIDADAAVIEPHDEAGDARALHRLAAWAVRITPVVAPDPPDGLWLDITGCARVHAGEARLMRSAVRALERLGFPCRAAIAPTLAGAGALARFGPADRAIVADDELMDAIAALPIAALRLSDDTTDALAEIGIDRIDQAMALPREDLAARFGPGPIDALDRIAGRAFEPIDPVRPAPPAEAAREFAGPVCDIAAIERTTRDLIGALCDGLSRRALGARGLRIALDRSDLDPVIVDIALARPCADPDHLWTVARPRIERIHMGFGVDRITVRAASTAAIRHTQRAHWAADPRADAAQDARRIAEMADILAGRLGPDRITTVRAVASHDPHRAFRHEAIAARHTVRAAPDTHPMPTMPRPTRLFPRPEPARVIAVTPDGPPYRIEWRGAVHEVVRAIGPERLAGEWWREMGAALLGRSRDAFRIATADGRWLWVCREGGGSTWTVRGEWM